MQHRHITRNITIGLSIVMFCCLWSCTKDTKKGKIGAVTDRTQIPILDAYNVSTVISDSGITRYRIKAPRWEIYDKAEPSYWEFKEGIVLENFDTELNIDASIQSDYAIYKDKEQIWELDGNVRAINLEGEVFETEQLFWNQKTERVYSDSLIHITRANSIITGRGFESNQTMTQYTIRNPEGIFPINEQEQ